MSEAERAYQIAGEYQYKARYLERVMNALGDITGFYPNVIVDALALCDKYHVDFNEATENFNAAEISGRKLDVYRCLMADIGFFVVNTANASFCQATGVEEFFEVDGSDSTSFWIRCDDSSEACLRELFETQPGFTEKLNPTARALVDEMCIACEIEIDPPKTKRSMRR